MGPAQTVAGTFDHHVFAVGNQLVTEDTCSLNWEDPIVAAVKHEYRNVYL
jgi:hypothetical protein